MKATRLSPALVEGLALVVALAGALWFVVQWHGQRDSGRAEALAELLATSHTPRMIANSGVEAWLLTLLRSAGAELPETERESYERLLNNADGPLLTEDMRAVADRLRARPAHTPKLHPREPMTGGSTEVESVRAFQEQRAGEHTLVITRRRSLVEANDEPAELDLAAAHVGALVDGWNEGLMALAGVSPLISGPLRATRVYAVLEDGSYLSMPVADVGERAQALERERKQLQARPRSPSLGSNSLFTRFDYGSPLEDQAYFTGIYPDLAGEGFVASLAVPVFLQDQNQGLRAVIAVDLIVVVDLERLIAAAIPELELELTGRVEPIDSPMWHPWSTIASALPADTHAVLRREVQLQANREAEEASIVPRAPIVHHRSVHGRGVLFALQVREKRWLVGWIGNKPGPSPWLPAGLTPMLVLGLVLWGRRLRRRRGDLDLLDLPLVVVDPSDDKVVSCNGAASELGVVEGEKFQDHVIGAGDRAQGYYQAQQGSGERRRAYGVELRLGAKEGDARGRRPPFALVRSVSLDEPAPWLGASAMHRLGLICVVDHDKDLAHYVDQSVAVARQEERNRLAALINHGADTLARVLAWQLAEESDEDDQTFARWLAEYLLRRLDVSQWVLAHWNRPALGEADSDPPSRARRPRLLGPENLCRALARYERIFAMVEQDASLRAQLHWNNGTLAAPCPEGPLHTEIDWPDDYRLTVPANGLFGYLLGEALTNAIKHGAPGCPIELEVDLDRSRRELCFVLRNYLLDPPASITPKAYGGLEIIMELGRLCGWTVHPELGVDAFELRWTCPVTLEVEAGQVD